MKNLELELRTYISSEKDDSKHLRKYLKLDTVYHYTDLNGAIGILENKSIFCTDTNYLNDTKEIEYGFHVITNTIIDILIKKSINNYSHFGIEESELLKKILDELRNWKTTNMFISCFSSNKDQLSQWRGYGDNGNGIAIGFDLSSLRDSLNIKTTNMIVEYEPKNQENEIEEILSLILDFFINKLSEHNISKEEFTKQEANIACSILMDFIPGYKDSGFKEENEFRLLFNNNHRYKNNVIEKKYRTNGKYIIPYFELLSKNKCLPINEIVIGPSLYKERVKNSILDILEKNDYKNVNIKYSKIPFIN